MYTLTVMLRYATITKLCASSIEAYKLLTEYKAGRDVVSYSITKGAL